MAEEEGLLNDCWTLYFRDPNNKSDWSLSSFHELGTISTIRDYAIMWDAIKDKLMHGIFFMMREHISPTFEDPSNANGMAISMKFPYHQLNDVFNYFMYRILGETFVLTDDPIDNENINGVQFITKRKQGFVMKVWLKDKKLADPNKLNLRQDMVDAIFKYDNLSIKN